MKKWILLIVLLTPLVAYGQSKKQLDADSDGAIDMSLGGTGISLSDPGADRLLFWDDSATDMGWLTPSAEFTITGTTIGISSDSITEVMFDSTNGPTDNYVLSYDSGSGGFTWIVGAGGLGNVVEDITPQLGGNLDIQAFSIEGVDSTEFGYVDGVTSDIQTQLNAKEGTLTNEAGLYSALSDVSLFLEDVSDDTSPQLGGSLDLNAKTVTDATGIDDDDCTGDQGKYWWDSTDNQWEFCNLNSGTPLTVGLASESANYTWTGEHTFTGTVSLPAIDDISEITTITLSPIILAEPDTLQGISDAWPLYHFIAESHPNGVTITSIHISTSSTCTDDLNFEEWSNNGTAWSTDATVEAITLSGTHTEDDGSLSDANIAADGWLYVDLDDTPTDIDYLSVTISFTSQ